jgi:hypothetical protein
MTGIADDVIALLKHDTSCRAVHYCCLRANPFCDETDTFMMGVKRLDAWLALSVELSIELLNQIVVIVLASFQIVENQVICINTLNETWLHITRECVSPCRLRAFVDHDYITNARMLALCVRYNYFSDRYADVIMAANPKGCAPATRRLLRNVQRLECAERVKRNIVSNLVQNTILNVLKGVRSGDAKAHRVRLKKDRRKLVKSMQVVSLDISSLTEGASMAEELTSVSVTDGNNSDSGCEGSGEGDEDSGEGGEGSGEGICNGGEGSGEGICNGGEGSGDGGGGAVDECIICFDIIGSRRSLLTCGHARCCAVCAAAVVQCPMCRLPVHVIMEIYV